MLKVLFCGLQYEYGKKEMGLSFEYRNFFRTLQGMQNVFPEFFAVDELSAQYGREGMNQKLLERVRELKPDLLFCFLFTDELKKETIAYITQRTGTQTFNWFADDHWRFPIYSKYWAPLFTAVGTTDSEAVAKYQALGVRVVHTQWGYSPQQIPHSQSPIFNEYKDTIAFVGKKYGKRENYIKTLQKAGLPAKGFGKGWESGIVSDDVMAQIFASSAINLNFTESYVDWKKQLVKLFIAKKFGKYGFDGHHLLGNIQSAWGTRRRQIKARIFEIPACGGFLLTGEADNLQDYFDDGKELVVFRSLDDLVEKCKFYLAHPELRHAIAAAGLRRVLRDHTYTQRFLEIFRALGLDV